MALPLLSPCVPDVSEPLLTTVLGDELLELHAAATSKPAHGRAASQWTRFMDTSLPCDIPAVADGVGNGSPWKKKKNS
jgi:hypothetical protein